MNRKERLKLIQECSTCGKQFTLELTAAEKRRALYRKHCSVSCANRRNHSKETRAKIGKGVRKSSKSSTRVYFSVGLEERVCTICSTVFYLKPYKSKKTCGKRCKNLLISRSNKGHTGGLRTNKESRFRGEEYRGIWMHSSWETAFAKHLDGMGIVWERDQAYKFNYTNIEGKTGNYYPDFYLPFRKLFVEVKGYWTEKDRYKMKEVLRLYSNNKFLILETLDAIKDFK